MRNKRHIKLSAYDKDIVKATLGKNKLTKSDKKFFAKVINGRGKQVLKFYGIDHELSERLLARVRELGMADMYELEEFLGAVNGWDEVDHIIRRKRESDEKRINKHGATSSEGEDINETNRIECVAVNYQPELIQRR